jgi:hypothetical protein
MVSSVSGIPETCAELQKFPKQKTGNLLLVTAKIGAASVLYRQGSTPTKKTIVFRHDGAAISKQINSCQAEGRDKDPRERS